MTHYNAMNEELVQFVAAEPQELATPNNSLTLSAEDPNVLSSQVDTTTNGRPIVIAGDVLADEVASYALLQVLERLGKGEATSSLQPDILPIFQQLDFAGNGLVGYRHLLRLVNLQQRLEEEGEVWAALSGLYPSVTMLGVDDFCDILGVMGRILHSSR